MSHSDPISTDLPCLVCSYNLRGLKHSGACPECGLHVRRTVDASDPDAAIEREAIRWDHQVAEYEQQTRRVDRQLSRQEQTLDRFEHILGQWEQYSKRFDRLLTALETMLRKSGHGT